LGQWRVSDFSLPDTRRRCGRAIREALGNRDALRGFENARLLFGSDPSDRPGSVGSVGGAVGAALLLVSQAGRMVAPAKGAQTEEAWAQTKVLVSARLRSATPVDRQLY